jgi:hypothetical protein
MNLFSLNRITDYATRASESLKTGWHRLKKWLFYTFSPNAIPEKPPLTPLQKEVIATEKLISLLNFYYKADAETLFILADIHLSMPFPAMALILLKRAIAVLPEDPSREQQILRDRLYYRFGQYHEQNLQTLKAVYWYSKITRPQSLYRDQANIALGNIYLSKAIDNTPDTDSLYYRQYHQKALKHFKAAALSGNDDARKLFYYTAYTIDDAQKWLAADTEAQKTGSERQLIQKKVRDEIQALDAQLRDFLDRGHLETSGNIKTTRDEIINTYKEYVTMLRQEENNNQPPLSEEIKLEETGNNQQSSESVAQKFSEIHDKGQNKVINTIDDYFERETIAATRSAFHEAVKDLLKRYRKIKQPCEKIKENPKCIKAIYSALAILDEGLLAAKDKLNDKYLVEAIQSVNSGL